MAELNWKCVLLVLRASAVLILLMQRKGSQAVAGLDGREDGREDGSDLGV